MSFRRFFALFCAFAWPLVATFAQTTYVPASQDGVELNLARNGNEVIVTWSIPSDMAIKRFEIYRNTHSDVKGRGRAGSVRTEPAVFLDQVADAGQIYWYWLKITLPDERVVNVGPVATPPGEVWAP